MKLLAMRDLNVQDPPPPLGPKVTPPTPPEPPPLRPTSTPGIMQRPDGKLETNLPMPPPDPLALAKDVHESFATEIYKKAFDAYKERSWWVTDFADIERRAMAQRLGDLSAKEQWITGCTTGRISSAEPVILASVADDLKRAWQADLANIERRWFASAGSLADMPPLFKERLLPEEKRPPPMRATLKQCVADYKRNKARGAPTPLMVLGTVYPKEALEDGYIVPGLAEHIYHYDGECVVPLPGKSGSDYFP